MHTSSVLHAIDFSPSVSIAAIDGATVTIPDANFLFHADFKRAGSDLTLTGQDGQRVVVPDYFKQEHLPTLLSSEGSALTGDVVSALAGSVAPNQYAQAGAPVQTDPLAIGRVASAQGSATAIRNGVAITLNSGDLVRKGDVILTGSDSALGVIFTDGTTFNLSANSRMVLSEFVFSAGGSSNSAFINLVQGSITFIAGEVAKTGDMRVGTPVASLGIRGTAVQVDIDVNSGETKLSVLVEPNGVVGSFNVYSLSGTLLGTVNNAGVLATIVPTGPFQAAFSEAAKSPAELQQAQLIVQQVFQTQQVGQAIMQQQPVTDSKVLPAGTQITASPTELSTTKLHVAVTATPTDVRVDHVQALPPPPGAPPFIPLFVPGVSGPLSDNPAPLIHIPTGGIIYWASAVLGSVTPINHISFSDVNTGNTLVYVSFKADDAGDVLSAVNLSGSGVTVFGNGTSEIGLEGTIADINAYLFHGNLSWDPSGGNEHEPGLIAVKIDDNGLSPGGETATRNLAVSEFVDPDFTGAATVNFSNVNFMDISYIDAGGGNDTITTSWSHQGSTTLYDGGLDTDTIHLLFTPDQLAEILADFVMQDNLESFLDNPIGSTLDLSGSSWNAKAQNFENADLYLVTGFGGGRIVALDAMIPNPDFIIGTAGDEANLTGVGAGSHVLVGLAGNDRLVGNIGNDVLLGGAGDDTLVGGRGNDVLSGSSGHDVFVFTEVFSGAVFGQDIVVDFHVGEDTVEISKSIFADAAAFLAALSEDVDGNAVITVDANNSITLMGVSKIAVIANHDDFHLVV